MGGVTLRQNFSEIAEGSRLLLNLTHGNKSLEMGATITKHVKNNIAMITLDSNNGQVLKFDGITI